MEIDEHGWLQENARDTPTPPTQPLVGPRENRRHSLGVGRVSTGLSYSSAYDKPEQVCGRTVTMVTVRPQQMLMNTRAKRRYRGVSPANPLRVGQAARLPAPEQIRAAAQEEHREEQRRDLRECRCRHWNRDITARPDRCTGDLIKQTVRCCLSLSDASAGTKQNVYSPGFTDST